jgi:hypothetical protein
VAVAGSLFESAAHISEGEQAFVPVLELKRW